MTHPKVLLFLFLLHFVVDMLLHTCNAKHLLLHFEFLNFHSCYRMSDFDERSGIVACDTLWGRWYQTIEDVTVEVNVPEGTRGKECMCEIKPKHLKVVVKGKNIIEVLSWVIMSN